MGTREVFRERINLDGGLIASVYCWYDDGVERGMVLEYLEAIP